MLPAVSLYCDQRPECRIADIETESPSLMKNGIATLSIRARYLNWDVDLKERSPVEERRTLLWLVNYLVDLNA